MVVHSEVSDKQMRLSDKPVSDKPCVTVIGSIRWSNNLNWEIFATNNIRNFRELTSLVNFFVANIPAHAPKYRYRQSMVRLAKFSVTNFSAHQIWRQFVKFTVCEYFRIEGIDHYRFIIYLITVIIIIKKT